MDNCGFKLVSTIWLIFLHPSSNQIFSFGELPQSHRRLRHIVISLFNPLNKLSAKFFSQLKVFHSTKRDAWNAKFMVPVFLSIFFFYYFGINFRCILVLCFITFCNMDVRIVINIHSPSAEYIKNDNPWQIDKKHNTELEMINKNPPVVGVIIRSFILTNLTFLTTNSVLRSFWIS